MRLLGIIVCVCWEEPFACAGNNRLRVLRRIVRVCWEESSAFAGNNRLRVLGRVVCVCWEESCAFAGKNRLRVLGRMLLGDEHHMHLDTPSFQASPGRIQAVWLPCTLCQLPQITQGVEIQQLGDREKSAMF